MTTGDKSASPKPSFFNCQFNSCSTTPIVSVLMKCLQVSVTSSGTQSTLMADAKRMSCLVDSCSFLKWSFFFSSFSAVSSSCLVKSSLWVAALLDWQDMLAVSCWRITSFGLPREGANEGGVLVGVATGVFGRAGVVSWLRQAAW